MDRIRRFRRWRIALPAVVLVAAAAWLLGPWAARQIGANLISTDPIERADAIVVLAAFAPDRTLEAVDLYRERYAPLIVFSSEERQSGAAFRRLDTLGVTIPESHETMSSIAIQAGVPKDAILMADIRAISTRSEAIRLRNLLEPRHLNSIIAVTSKSHSTRVGKIFRQVFGARVRVIVRAARYDDFDPDLWWRERWQARTVLMEYLKLMDFYWVSLTGSDEA